MNEHTDTAATSVKIGEDSTPKAESDKMQRWKRVTLTSLGSFALVVATRGIYWSIQPDSFEVQSVALERVDGDASRLVPGAVAVATVGQVARTLLEKPGGYVHNDTFLPGAYLDNMPSWEHGVIKEVRDSLGALRNHFSRSQTQSIENLYLRKAHEFLNYDVSSWILPSTESEFREGIEALDRYFEALVSGEDRTARFFPRADNLAAYLMVVEKRLGSYAQRLSASVGDDELTAALVTAGAESQSPAQETASSRTRTPWLEIDNVFYEARGYSWALLHMFKAIAVEFEPVLRDKNAQVSVQQIILDLEESTKRMWSPMVLNGHGFGYVVNHSLVLASYISRANAAVLDLRILLQQG